MRTRNAGRDIPAQYRGCHCPGNAEQQVVHHCAACFQTSGECGEHANDGQKKTKSNKNRKHRAGDSHFWTSF